MLFNCIMYAILLISALIFNIFFEEYLALFVLVFLIILPIFSFISLFFLRKQLNIQLSTPAPLNELGENTIVRITASTKYKFLSGKLRIKINAKNTFTGDETQNYIYISPSFVVHKVDLLFNSHHCGSMTFTISEIKVYDFLMLFSLKKKLTQNSLSCITTVMPLGISSETSVKVESGIENESNEYSKKHDGDDPSEIYDIREYREGDRIRRIHRWLSEKHDTIIVKDFGEPISKGVLVLADFSENADLSDGMLDILYGVINALIKDDIKPTVKWLSRQKRQVMEFSASSNFNIHTFFSTLLESAECQGGLFKSYDFHEDIGRCSSIICICSHPTKETAARLYEISELIPTTIYEAVEENHAVTEDMKVIPAEYKVMVIPSTPK